MTICLSSSHFNNPHHHHHHPKGLFQNGGGNRVLLWNEMNSIKHQEICSVQYCWLILCWWFNLHQNFHFGIIKIRITFRVNVFLGEWMNYADTELKYEKRFNVAEAPKNSKSNMTNSDQVSHMGNFGILSSRSSFLKRDTAIQTPLFDYFTPKEVLIRMSLNQTETCRAHQMNIKGIKKTLKGRRKTTAGVTEVSKAARLRYLN